MKCYWKDDGEWIKGDITNEGSFLIVSSIVDNKLKKNFRLQDQRVEFHPPRRDRMVIVGYERIDVHRKFEMRIIVISPGWRKPDGSK